MAVLAGVLLAGVLLAACGGGGTDRLSRAALADRAEAVCRAGQEEADRLRAEAEPGARGQQAAKEIDATLEALDTQIEGFEGLRGPERTDDDVRALVRHLRAAAAGVERLREVVIEDDLTVDEAIRANTDVVDEVNRASARAADDLLALGWLACAGVGSDGG